MVGVFMFLFYVFNQPPMLFNNEHTRAVEQSARAGEMRDLQASFETTYRQRREAAIAMAQAEGAGRDAARERFRAATAGMQAIRGKAAAIIKDVTHEAGFGDRTGDTPKPDVNYVFPTFVTTRLPQGLVGLIIAAIFAAAMSATAGELSATATATVMDVYKRLLNTTASDAHYLMVSRLAVAFWGIVACVVAHVAVQLGSLIEVVNRIGSIFYGSLLGVFVLALAFRRANGHGAFAGLLAGILFVVAFAFHPATKSVSYLWHNPIGVAVVLVVGMTVSLLTPPQRKPV
jgi:Na+(H+)/acetate symporter ActP